jgi:hypothetical protein
MTGTIPIPIYNPYANTGSNNKRTMNATSPKVPPSHTEKNQSHNSHNSHSAYSLFATMGIQSQNREGSIKKCRKTATRVKHKRRKLQQSAVTGGLAFNPERDCIICEALAKSRRLGRLGITVAIPHRSHDARCPKNRKTQGRSERFVQDNKTTAENLKNNSEPIMHGVLPVGTTASQKAHALNLNKTNSQENEQNSSDKQTQNADGQITKEGFLDTRMNTTSIATELHKELNEQIAQLGKSEDYDWLQNCPAPTPIALLMDYILAQFEHRRPKEPGLPTTASFLESQEHYNRFFAPGECFFKFQGPKSGEAISPKYHSIIGQSIFVLDWQRSHPEVQLSCYECKMPSLQHDRFNFKKNRKLFPVWLPSGTVSWGCCMKYDCTKCGERYAANDGRLLAMLPAHVRSAYPVEPRYASGGFHFHLDTTDELEPIIKTYGSGDFYCKKLYRTMGLGYLRKVENYLSESPTSSYVTIDEWTNSNYPPSGQSIRKYYQDAERSPHTPYNISNFDRYEREIQSVTTDSVIAIDWTFQICKNYTLGAGAKACFTMCTETGEIAALGIVNSTACSQVSHMLQEIIAKRPTFRPRIIYTDTWPNSREFWTNVFGLLLVGRLGLFHLMKRILDTLNSRCALYWQALVEFKSSIYRYNDDDEANLIRVLKNGTMAKDGKCHSDEDIRQLRHSKRWKQRYQEYLRKLFYPTDTAKYRLVEWTNKFKDLKDMNGKSLFSRDTEKVAIEQTKKVQYIQDLEGIDMYRQLPPGPRSTHGLPRWHSLRPESSLEKFHELLAHFGNTGMAPGLSDTLSIKGTAEHSVGSRHKQEVQKARLEGRPSTVPQYLEDVPLFFNHSLLDYLNRVALSRGLDQMFSNVRCLKPNNGEVFMSKYYEEQEKRNRLYGQNEKTGQCKCPACVAKPFPLVGSEVGASESLATAVPTRAAPAQSPSLPAAKPPPNPILPAPTRPLPVQQFIPTTAAFVPYPSIVLPKDCCYPFYPFYCKKFSRYLLRKHQNGGGGVFGRKPHDSDCSSREKT